MKQQLLPTQQLPEIDSDQFPVLPQEYHRSVVSSHEYDPRSYYQSEQLPVHALADLARTIS